MHRPRLPEWREEGRFAGKVLELGTGTGLVGTACWLRGAREVAMTDLPAAIELARANVAANVGAAAGFLAGLFGVGGGAVVVPLLALATDLDHKTALGTSLCAMVPTGVAGVLAHRRLGHVKLAAAAPLGLGTCVGAFAGGRLASGLDEEPMRLGFGALMIALGAKTLLKKP